MTLSPTARPLMSMHDTVNPYARGDRSLDPNISSPRGRFFQTFSLAKSIIKTTKTLANLELRLALGIALAIHYVSSLLSGIVKVKTQEETPEENVHV